MCSGMGEMLLTVIIVNILMMPSEGEFILKFPNWTFCIAPYFHIRLYMTLVLAPYSEPNKSVPPRIQAISLRSNLCCPPI